jgi:rRNA maturation protein Nop10
MHLRFYLNESGERVYTLKTILDNGSYTLNAHPGIFIIDILGIILNKI